MRARRIGEVLREMTAEKYVSLTEQAERQARANQRMARQEAEEEQRRQNRIRWEREQIAQLGRGEYQSLRHALWKEKLYTRAVRRDEWQAFQNRKLLERWEEREIKKEEWQEFLLEEVAIDLTHLPEF